MIKPITARCISKLRWKKKWSNKGYLNSKVIYRTFKILMILIKDVLISQGNSIVFYYDHSIY